MLGALLALAATICVVLGIVRLVQHRTNDGATLIVAGIIIGALFGFAGL